MASIEINSESLNLPQLRELARLKHLPSLAEMAGDVLLGRMMVLADTIQSANPTDFMGREHVDAFAATSGDPAYTRGQSGKLFNPLVTPQEYGYRDLTKRAPQRMVFGLRPADFSDTLVVAKRSEVGLPAYPDEYPSNGTLVGRTSLRNALESAVEIGSFVNLVQHGIELSARETPDREPTLQERFAVGLMEHVS